MTGDLSTWAAICVVAGVTLASRLAGSFLMAGVESSPRVERFLDGLSVGVIAALVASTLAQSGLREAAAVAIAVLVMLRWVSAALAMLAGMVLAATWAHFIAL